MLSLIKLKFINNLYPFNYLYKVGEYNFYYIFINLLSFEIKIMLIHLKFYPLTKPVFNKINN